MLSTRIPLSRHDFLSGAYWLTDFDSPLQNLLQISSPEQLQIPDVINPHLTRKSSVFPSMISNPFVFPASNAVSVSDSSIIAVASAARPLSQGQFGHYPLYAFTSDGVWALEVSSTGTYSARQPITRDVCINHNGITQLDSAVLFPSDRGIMLISGSQTICISEKIDSEFPFNILDLPGLEKLHDLSGHDPEIDKCLPTLPFAEFLKQCKMVYDYVHQRVIIYAPDISYAYVYSLKSHNWGMTFSSIASHINSYPEALATDVYGNVLNLSQPVAGPVNCFYVSRPLKLDTPDIHKTIQTIIQRGNFAKGHVSTVLYGSRNLMTWHLVWSSKDHYLRGFRGTPYKYFRVAGVANLDQHETIAGASILFYPRLTNQPR